MIPKPTAEVLAATDADPLVEALGYARPCPGWYAVRAWATVPLYLPVTFVGPAKRAVNVVEEMCEVRMTGTYQHPSREYVYEVVRQLLAGERSGWLTGADSTRWTKIPAVYAETCRWGDEFAEGEPPGAPVYDYQVLSWDTDQGVVAVVDRTPWDMFRAGWHMATPRQLRIPPFDRIRRWGDSDDVTVPWAT